MSSPSSPILARIYIVRHGETDENRKGIIQGQIDTKLNEEGVMQAKKVAEAFRDSPVEFEKAWTSDLGRAVAVRFSPLLFFMSLRLMVCLLLHLGVVMAWWDGT